MAIQNLESGENTGVFRQKLNSNFIELYSNMSVDTAVRGLTGKFDSTYTTVNANSAQWAVDSTTDTAVRSLTGNFNSTYTTVNANSAQWAVDSTTDTAVRGLTSNYSSVYTTVNGNSASYATISFTNSKFLPLTGGTVTGNISAVGNHVFESSNSNPTVRITQNTTGTGHALLVEDLNNPDTSPFVINQHGAVGIGNIPTNNPSVSGAILRVGGEIGADSIKAQDSNIGYNFGAGHITQSSYIWQNDGGRYYSSNILNFRSVSANGVEIPSGTIDTSITPNRNTIDLDYFSILDSYANIIIDVRPFINTFSFAANNIVVNSNKVGIGTSTPNEKLTVSGNISATGNLTVIGNTTLSGLHLVYNTETKATPTINSNVLTLNLASASFFSVSLNAVITTFTLTNVPASPKVYSFTLQFVADGTARTVTWPTGTRWAGGTNPTLTSTLNKVDTFTFLTHDGGTNWFAYTSNQNQ